MFNQLRKGFFSKKASLTHTTGKSFFSKTLFNKFSEGLAIEMGIEEDTYSSIFQALKHPIRRRILRMLKEQPLTYTEILNELGVDNGLLNYHLENMKDLITKGDDGRYILSEFGRASVQLLNRIEEPVTINVEKSNPRQSLYLKILSVTLIILLSLSTFTLYSSYLGLKTEQDKMHSYLQAFSTLFNSNVTPPVSKIEAVAIALSSDNWNSSRLRGAEINAVLYYMSFFVGDDGVQSSISLLHAVASPVVDYSPKAEHNVTVPGLMPRLKGTMWYHYVWVVTVHISGDYSISPAGYYYVDAFTGEIIPHGALF